LMKEIISIRMDTLWRMLGLRKEGRLPKVDEEGATGEFDNKGAMFIPGGFIFEDSDRKPIEKNSVPNMDAAEFRKRVRAAMHYDNATLIYEDGIVPAVNLDNGFFAKIAGSILSFKQEATKRKPLLSNDPPDRIQSRHITKSYCPTFISPPYGARTKLSSCIAACLIRPSMYYVQCRMGLGLRGREEKEFWDGIKASRKPVMDKDDKMLAGPYVVVCHNTRYRREVLTGITKILGFGKFGEFAVFTLEEATNDLLHELDYGKSEFNTGDVFAEYEGLQVVGVLRVYPKTTPGKRLQRTTPMLVSPSKDLELDLETITEDAKIRYNVR
jgi:hypothetical protein